LLQKWFSPASNKGEALTEFGLTSLEFAALVSTVLPSRTSLAPLLEGRKSLELISAVYESIETGQEVAMQLTPRLSRIGAAL